jgi:enoyl-CoA hydratase/carnithine racemase
MSIGDVDPSTNGRGADDWWSFTHMRLDRRSRGYCRVTFDHPPSNAITATTVGELTELVGLIEQDPDLNVTVFASANPGVYLTDDDGPPATHAWPELLVRLSRAPVISVAAVRGCARGAGRDFVLACDLRFASRDVGGPDAEERGHVDRIVAEDELDAEVDAIASRLARLGHDAIADAKFGRRLSALLGDA